MVKEERKGLRRRPMEATVLEGEIGKCRIENKSRLGFAWRDFESVITRQGKRQKETLTVRR